MILHAGILALIIATAIVLAMLLYASWIGVRILRRWDAGSSSEEQLLLERSTFLVSSIASTTLGFQAASLLLFLYTIDDIHGLFVGAMCATGSLNAAPWGWAALGVKIVLLFLSLIWIVLHRLDQSAGDFPLVRIKYVGLLLLAPWWRRTWCCRSAISRAFVPRSLPRAAVRSSARAERHWRPRLRAFRPGRCYGPCISVSGSS